MTELEPLVEAKDVAEYLHVPKRWVQDRSSKNGRSGQRIPCIHLGRYVRYRLSTVLAWLEAQDNEPRRRR